MKIEMGESLIGSWLTHVKECQLVQMNWEPSPKWRLNNLKELEEYFEKTYPLFSNLHKGNIKLESFIRQAECDCIGLSYDGTSTSVHAVDVAFHKAGLNYNKDSVKKVIEKTVRTAICIYGYLDIDNADIYFATPLTRPSTDKSMREAFNDLQVISDNLGFHFRYHFITGDEFKDEIIEPICLASGEVSNDNELWLRSYQLLGIFKDKPAKKVKINSTNSSKLSIGELARYAFTNVIQNGKVSANEISKLLDPVESKKTFNIEYPILVNKNSLYPTARYYSPKSTIIKLNNEEYLLTNHWFESRSRKQLEDWIQKHN